MTSTVKTQYWHQLNDGRIQCDLCPRYCKLNEGQQGLCFVRARQQDQIVLTTYGRSSGFCIDPIEKKPLNHFLPGTPVLSFGTAGCNLACKFCQNWDISKSRKMDKLANQASPQQLAKACVDLKCRSIAYTYNDPIIFHEYAVDVAQACRARNIKNIAVTAGYICDKPREAFFSDMDAANIDLKAFTQDFYRKVTGSDLAVVLDTLLYLKQETNVWFEITNLIIPGQNDSEAELHAMTEWILQHLGPSVPLHFSAFHPDYKMQDIHRTPLKTLQMARKIALSKGLRYVYTGNVHDPAGDTTFCHHCNAPLIIRDWYQLKAWHLDSKGACQQCGTVCAGHFEAQAGTWGAKRQPIKLHALT